MPTVRFLPQQLSFEVEPSTKLLVAANRNKLPIRFGCASCRCGTCGVKVAPVDDDTLSPMKDNERELLSRMRLPVDGSGRLACQARILAREVDVDLDFQHTYSPDDGE
jgi:ferredoxin